MSHEPDAHHEHDHGHALVPVKASWAARALAWIFGAWKVMISPYMPPACRFTPTCSEYGREAVLTHGLFKGGWLTLKRISRCHPFGGEGFDPVPPRGEPR